MNLWKALMLGALRRKERLRLTVWFIRDDER